MKKFMKVALTSLATLSLVLVMAGCGGGNESEEMTADTTMVDTTTMMTPAPMDSMAIDTTMVDSTVAPAPVQ